MTSSSKPLFGDREDREVSALGDRSEFPLLELSSYMNHAAISPPSTFVRAAILKTLDDFSTRGAHAFFDSLAQRDELKATLATLLSSTPQNTMSPQEAQSCSMHAEDFALAPNTTTGLQYIAHAFPWMRGDGVLLFKGEFPTNITPWLQAAKRHDLRVFWADSADLARHEGPVWDDVEWALSQGVTLVAVSAVQFQTGARMPLEELITRCRSWGAQICVDGIQACGAVPIPLSRIDYLACGGHKWMMGVEGAGFLYIHPDRIDALAPQTAGWLSHEAPLDFLFEVRRLMRYDKPLRLEASAFEGGAQSAIGYAALWASARRLNALGTSAIFNHIQTLLTPLEEGLVTRGFESHRCPDLGRRSGTLSVSPPAHLSLTEWAQGLYELGVSCATPDGHLRFSPHWPNRPSEVDLILDAVDQLIDRGP